MVQLMIIRYFVTIIGDVVIRDKKSAMMRKIHVIGKNERKEN